MLVYYEAVDIGDSTNTRLEDEPESALGSLEEAKEKKQAKWDQKE